MTTDPHLLDAVLKLKSEMQTNLIKTKQGDIIDISKLPDRLLDLHNKVQKAEEKDRPLLSAALEDILGILDDLSGEIQNRYHEISDQVSIFDEGLDGLSTPVDPQTKEKE
ncbi:MAG: hypothetical protein JKY12_03480 [Sneathiella sp.]|nr:hypothetical protein [Sneathiella sp.]